MADLQSAALATWLRRPICFRDRQNLPFAIRPNRTDGKTLRQAAAFVVENQRERG